MVNQKNYDTEFCGNLAIHQTNSIQDYGFLLVVDKANLEIVQGSENLQDLLTVPIHTLIGTNLADLLSSTDLENMKKEIAKGNRNRIPFQLSIDTQAGALALDILAHVKDSYFILEIEKGDSLPERSFTEVFQEVRSFISILEGTENLQHICEESIREIRRISGFDGIRMYQFDGDWNGTVIAEEITGELESYLGQTFPASDVPKQARALYVKNPFRLIPNRAYRASRLFPVINPITNGFLDLSDCNLRSIAGVHLEYMANMNVTASMSIRVMVDGRLWGLISCHHTSPKYLSSEHRSIFEWLSMEISYRISAVIKQEELQSASALFQQKSSITENIFNKGDIILGITQDEQQYLATMFSASGFSIVLDGKVTSWGITPKQEDLDGLLLWAENRSLGNVFATNELGSVYEEAKEFREIASGALVIPINRKPGNFLICFRPESIRDIKWGGDPNQAINFEKDGINYHPRNSFKLWLQTVYGQSKPWSTTELEIAESLKGFFSEFSSNRFYH